MSKDFSNYRLLIVDHHPGSAESLRKVLGEAGLEVSAATTAEELYWSLEQEGADLMLLDVQMAGSDGVRLSVALREHPDYRKIPVLFLTPSDAPGDLSNGFNPASDDFITRPDHREELLMRIRRQLTTLEVKRALEHQIDELKKEITGKDTLCSVVAHDLRVPMSSMKMTLNVLLLKMKEKGILDPEIVEMLESANEISEELFSLLDNLLKWTGSQLGKLEAVPQQINLTALAEEVVEIFSMVAAPKKITLHFHSAPAEDTEVFVDIDMIKTSIRNLLSNAIKYSYPESEVDVAVETNEQEVIFRVTDRGCGISEENQQKLTDAACLFTTFGTQHESGSGLGLLLVKEFLNLNRGRLFFRSKEGEGSTFGFALPRTDIRG